MIQIIISDTHSPKCINSALKYTEELLNKVPETEYIIINGDLLGIFSMDVSCLHKGKEITTEEKMSYLKSGAPKFYEKFVSTKQVSQQMVLEYVKERYEWVVEVLERTVKFKKTLFNLGNHESSLHFLVLRELPFLTGCDGQVVAQVSNEDLLEIFNEFEEKLYNLEKEKEFHYIRDKPIVIKGTLILGIPGESHSTEGSDPDSIAQVQKTKEVIAKAKDLLSQAESIIIYNHTQGKYDMSVGSLDTASVSLRHFMTTLPSRIKTKIFVQSHNHWNHTQFFENNGFYFIMNNAGLHNGIFNLLSFNDEGVSCYDADPVNKKTVKLTLAKVGVPLKSRSELVSRNYPDPDYVEIRSNVHMVLDKLFGRR